MTKIMKTNDLEVSHPHNCSSSTWPFLINYKFEAIPARTNNKLNPNHKWYYVGDTEPALRPADYLVGV